MLVVNRAGDIFGASLQAEKLFGLSREQLIGRVVESLLPVRFRDRHRQHRERFLATPETQFMQVPEIFALRGDTTEIPVDVSLSRLTIGSEMFAISAIRDATERVRMEELKRSEGVLRESEERFRMLADTAPVLIWQSGKDKLCTYFSKSWLDFTGRSMEEELGNGWAEGVHPDDLQKFLDTYTQHFERREQFRMEYRLRHHDGRYRWIVDIGVPRFNQDGSFAGYIGTGVDINDRKLAEDQLREYEKAVEAVEEMIAVVDREYRILLANRKYATMRNMVKEKILGRFVHEVLNREVFEAIVKPKLDECFQGKVVRYEMKYTYPELGERDMSISYFPIEGATGVEGAACIFQDITERKQMEEALAGVSHKLIEAQEQERTRIARDLHDDIAQRLALLAVEIDQLQHNLPDSPPGLRNRMVALRDRTTQISNDVQTISHELHSSKLEYLGIVTAINGFCGDFAEQQKLEIDFKSYDVPKQLSREISLCLFRVAQEALHNAAKHSGVQHFTVQLWGEPDQIHLIISDSGSGFDFPAVLRAKGLGLTSMRERVRLVNGTIDVESRPKHGTTIHVHVPIESEFAR
jgi:PAS domain S-box-containing protein